MARSLSILILTAFLLTGCGGGDAPAGGGAAGGGPRQGGTAVVALLSDFDAFNQFVSTTFETGEVMRRILYTPLVALDEDMNYVPYLAESMALSEDGLTLTFTLRPEATWHDGEPLTAEDVVWSTNMYMDPELAYANLQYFQFVDRVEATDEHTVVFHFTEPHSDAYADFLEWQPMPKHLLEDVPVSEMRSAPFNQNPVGSGPFRFVSWTLNQQAVFEAYEDFFLGRPNLDRVVFRIIPDQTTQLTELLTGRIDYVRGLPPAEAETVEESPNARLISYPGRSYVYLAWNTRNPLFESAAVRRALTMAINRQEIVDALLYGFGEVARTDVMPFQWQYMEDLEPLPYDPEQAREILAEAGWADSDGDGILDRNGRPFRFTLETNQGNDLREDILVIVQNNLSQIGIDAQPRLAEFNTLIDRLQNKDFDAAVSGWSVDFKFDPTETFGCEGGVYNFPSYCDEEADRAVRQALVTIDPEEARPLWEQYQETVARDQPYTFLYYLNERIGASNRLQGVVADARGYMVSVADWYIDE